MGLDLDAAHACPSDLSRPSMDVDAQRRVLNRSYQRLRRGLDVESVYPYLNEQGLLSEHERDILLNPYHTRQFKIDKLLQWIPMKGSGALDKFIDCLRKSSTEARGHEELADLLQRGVDRDRDNPDLDDWLRIPAPGSSTVKKASVVVLFGLLLLLLCPLLFHKYQLKQFLTEWRSPQSALLPRPCTPFIGRDREMSDAMRVIDLQSDEVRAVNVVGPTGVGKSCLAVQVGHQLTDSGAATVSYLDASLLSLDSLPDVILEQSTDYLRSSRNSTERLIHWLSLEMKYPMVVILDNYDRILATDRVRVSKYLDMLFENAAAMVKVLITSRKKVLPIFEHNFVYNVESITFDSSCQLLRGVSKRDLSSRDCESITRLMTGSTPFCLRVIGNVLKSTSADVSKIISILKKELDTHHGPGFGFDTQSDACVRVSLKSLKKRVLSFGKHLSLFPGSFSLTDACTVLSSLVSEECLVENLRESGLLLQTTEGNHYHFRDSLKKHFTMLREESGIDESSFWREYLKHFSVVLERESLKFHSNHTPQLHEIKTQEFRLFLRTYIDCCEDFPSLCYKVLHSLKVSIESWFLVSIFGQDDLVPFLQTTLSNIDLIIDSKELVTRRGDIVNLYAYFALILTELRPAREDFLFEQAQVWLDQHTSEVKISSTIKDFYLKLSHHYRRSGQLQKELYCHVKMLNSIGKLDECGLKTCNYSQVSEAYHRVSEYSLSAYFQKLYINQTDLSTLELVGALLTLHASQVGNISSEAEQTATEILEYYTNLADEESTRPTDIRHLELYHSISTVFRLHKWRDKACRVEERLLASVRETEYTTVEKEKVRRILFSVINTLSLAREYELVSKVVQCALETYTPEEGEQERSEIAALHLLLGTAELYNGRRRESIDSLKVVLDGYYGDSKLFNYARDACNAMLIQTHTELACFHIALHETLLAARSVYDFVTSPTFNADHFSVYYIYEFPVLVPGNLLADRIAEVPFGPYCIVFFLKWCLANVLYLFSIRFLVQVVNTALVILKLALVFSVPSFSLFLIHETVRFVKRVYRVLWSYPWSEDNSYVHMP